ncbi:MAG: glycosyltransferase family 2 protein [candidate division KSB1 bacterium]|nr:glycosyltransferase family 2 protein [candidate division KSB1 bacterium]
MIQCNAIKSWALLPDVEIILLGEEAGLAEAARELDVKHIPNVARSANGTPLISSMFQLARQNSKSDLLCIINADIILMPDFVEAAQRAMRLKDRFVMVSQRWDLDVTAPLDFSGDWIHGLRSMVNGQGQLHRPAGSDFFLFPKSCYQNIPDFTIGRAGWDNWMIHKARKEKWAVIDCTPSVMIVHQNHDYSHLPGGKPHYEHPETNENIRLAGGQANIRYTILDATHQLVGDKLTRPKMTSARFTRKFELFLRTVFFFLPENLMENIVRPKRWQKRLKKIIR